MPIGRKPIPSWLQVVDGVKTRSKYNKSPDAIQRQKLKLRAPKSLTLAQRVIWRDFVRQSAGFHLQPIDHTLLQMLVVHIDRFHEVERKLSASHLLIKTPNGMPQQSPYFSMLNKLTHTIKGLLAELGLTPPERARLGVLQPGLDDEPSDYFD